MRALLPLLLLGLLATPAAAQLTLVGNSGTATAATAYGSTSAPPPRTVRTTFGPLGGVARADLAEARFGTISAVQTGFGLNALAIDALFFDVFDFDWSAATHYDMTAENVGPSTTPLRFQFHLSGGRLRLDDRAGQFLFQDASVDVAIHATMPSSTTPELLWRWSLDLRGSGSGTPVVTSTLFWDEFGIGAPALGPVTVTSGQALLDVGAFTGLLTPGSLRFGEEALITYDLSARLSSPGLDGEGGHVAIGDPFDASGNYGAGITLLAAPAMVPEPATLALLAPALGAALLSPIARRSARGRRPR